MRGDGSSSHRFLVSNSRNPLTSLVAVSLICILCYLFGPTASDSGNRSLTPSVLTMRSLLRRHAPAFDFVGGTARTPHPAPVRGGCPGSRTVSWACVGAAGLAYFSLVEHS